MPAARSGAPFFSISGTMMLCRYAVERCSGGTTNEPVATRASCTAGISIAAAVASCSLVMIASGVPLGKKKANQVEASKSFMSCS